MFFGRNTPSECFFSSLRMQSYKKNSIFAVKRSIKLYKIVEAKGRYYVRRNRKATNVTTLYYNNKHKNKEHGKINQGIQGICS